MQLGSWQQIDPWTTRNLPRGHHFRGTFSSSGPFTTPPFQPPAHRPQPNSPGWNGYSRTGSSKLSSTLKNLSFPTLPTFPGSAKQIEGKLPEVLGQCRDDTGQHGQHQKQCSYHGQRTEGVHEQIFPMIKLSATPGENSCLRVLESCIMSATAFCRQSLGTIRAGRCGRSFRLRSAGL